MPTYTTRVPFFRGRRIKLEDGQIRFERAEQVANPKSKYITEKGRCNQKGTSMMYVSHEPGTPFSELNLEQDNEIVWVHYEAHEMRIFDIGCGLKLKKVASRKKLQKKLYESYKAVVESKESGLNEQGRNNVNTILHFFANEFAKVIHSKKDGGMENGYDITIALTERLLLENPHLDGICYPSVKKDLFGINCVLKDASAKKLKPVEFRHIKFHKTHDESKLIHESEVIAVGHIKEGDASHIHWREHQTPQGSLFIDGFQ